MRFLIVTHFYEAHGGGIERVAGHLCRALAAQGHSCTWAASAADAPPADDAITALPLRCIDLTERMTGLPMPIPGPRSALALLRAASTADVVIVHDALYVTSILAMIAAPRHGKPVILMQHISGIAFASRVMRLVMAIANRVVTRPMLGRADQVVFISETVRRSFAGLGYRRMPELHFNGVDQAIFHPGAGDRASFGLPEGPVVVFAGRFVEKKGLSIVRAVARRCPHVTFALVGQGPIDPGAWSLSNVRLMGSRTPADMGELFRCADMLLLPSVGEGYPLVIQEAMACGLPVICGEDSACADPGASQWLRSTPIDLADPETCADRIAPMIEQMAMSVTERRAMAAYARTTYSWAHMAEALAAMGQSLARGGLSA